MIWAKVVGENTVKGIQNLEGYCLRRLFCQKTELSSTWNDQRIQVLVLEKPYIVYMCIVEIH